MWQDRSTTWKNIESWPEWSERTQLFVGGPGTPPPKIEWVDMDNLA